MKYTFPLTLIAIGFISLYANAVIHGTNAQDLKFSSVGSLKIGTTQDVGCTATLISSQWIVTADHCTHATEDEGEDGSGSRLPTHAYEFRLGYDFNKPVFKVKLKKWVRIPAFKGQDIDLAFGQLASSVPLKELGIKSLKPLSQSWSAEDLKVPYIHIGYGARQAFGEPTEETDIQLSKKRQRADFKAVSTSGNAMLNLFKTESQLETIIQTYHPEIDLDQEFIENLVENALLIEKHSVHVWDARGRENPSQITIPQGGWQNTCFGDSGGPLLREVDGEMRIVGVVSQGISRTCGTLGTRFTTFGPNVLKVMKSLKIDGL